MFEDCVTVHEVKAWYKARLFEVHPDLHDASEFAHWNEATRLLNEAYHVALQGCHEQTNFGADNKEHTYYYNNAREQAVMDTIDMLIHVNLPPHVKISLVGTWVWVEGIDKQDTLSQDKMRHLKLRWHGERKVWYKASGRARYNPNVSLGDLKGHYGTREYAHEDRAEL
jgi:hypothetical protein